MTAIKQSRRYKFMIIPQQGDSVSSVVHYSDSETAMHTATTLVGMISRRMSGQVRADLQRMFQVKQAYVNVAVIDLVTKEAVIDKRIAL